MTWLEIVVNAWICDGCGIECLVADDGLPDGWRVSIDGERHVCAVCSPEVVAA